MRVSRRIDEVVALLEAYALGEIDLPEGRVTAAIRLLDWAIDDAPALANDHPVLVFPSRIGA